MSTSSSQSAVTDKSTSSLPAVSSSAVPHIPSLDLLGRHITSLQQSSFPLYKSEGVGIKSVCRRGLNRLLRLLGKSQVIFGSELREALGSLATVLQQQNEALEYLSKELTQIRQTAVVSDDPMPAKITVGTSSLMEARPTHFDVIHSAPVLMKMSERVLLYSIVFSLRPQRCLEIGTHKGGSSLIICAALDDVDAGYLVCVDPYLMVAPEHLERLTHRATLLKECSPEVLPQTVGYAGGRFDFALIDGDHETPGVIRDIEGVLSVLSNNAYLIFHDAYYFGVSDAIDQMLIKHCDCLTDCGLLSTEQTPENRSVDGRPVVWGGLRLLHYHSTAE